MTKENSNFYFGGSRYRKRQLTAVFDSILVNLCRNNEKKRKLFKIHCTVVGITNLMVIDPFSQYSFIRIFSRWYSSIFAELDSWIFETDLEFISESEVSVSTAVEYRR